MEQEQLQEVVHKLLQQLPSIEIKLITEDLSNNKFCISVVWKNDRCDILRADLIKDGIFSPSFKLTMTNGCNTMSWNILFYVAGTSDKCIPFPEWLIHTIDSSSLQRSGNSIEDFVTIDAIKNLILQSKLMFKNV